MPTIRTEKKRNFTCMSNRHLQDRSLSLKAKGLMSLMLSLPYQGWRWSLAGLSALLQERVSLMNGEMLETILRGLEESKKEVRNMRQYQLSMSVPPSAVYYT